MSIITEYIDNLFYLMPRNEAAAEMRLRLIESAEDNFDALLSWGKNEDEALGIIVSEFGSMETICNELGVSPIGFGDTPDERALIAEETRSSRKFAFGLALGIVAACLGFAAVIIADELFHSGGIGAALMFLFWGIGAGLIVFSAINHNRTKKLLRMGILPHESSDKKRRAKKLEDILTTAIMLGAVGIFLICGALYGNWHPTWIIIPIGGLLCGLVSSILEAIYK